MCKEGGVYEKFAIDRKWREIFDEFLKSGCGSGEGDILISSNTQHEKKQKECKM